MNKKAILLALAVVFVLGSVAYAHSGGSGGMGMFAPWMDNDGSARTKMTNRGAGLQRNAHSIEFPQEIRDKMQELHRTRLEMRLELAQEKPDVEKARLLFEKVQKSQGELAKWRFEKYLETLTK